MSDDAKEDGAAMSDDAWARWLREAKETRGVCSKCGGLGTYAASYDTRVEGHGDSRRIVPYNFREIPCECVTAVEPTPTAAESAPPELRAFQVTLRGDAGEIVFTGVEQAMEVPKPHMPNGVGLTIPTPTRAMLEACAKCSTQQLVASWEPA